MHRQNLLLMPTPICPLSESRRIHIALLCITCGNRSGSARIKRAEQTAPLPNDLRLLLTATNPSAAAPLAYLAGIHAARQDPHAHHARRQLVGQQLVAHSLVDEPDFCFL